MQKQLDSAKSRGKFTKIIVNIQFLGKVGKISPDYEIFLSEEKFSKNFIARTVSEFLTR